MGLLIQSLLLSTGSVIQTYIMVSMKVFYYFEANFTILEFNERCMFVKVIDSVKDSLCEFDIISSVYSYI